VFARISLDRCDRLSPVLVPASVLAVVVSDVRTGPPVGRKVVTILDRHMVVLDHIVVFHVVVGPRPPAPH